MTGVNIGIIGVGRIGTLHARTLVELAGVADVAIADANEDRAAQLAAELGARTASVDALFAEPLDALVVATATPAHAPLVRRAVHAGIPVFCEKPVAPDPATLDPLHDHVGRSG